jgi:hypothetical protein
LLVLIILHIIQYAIPLKEDLVNLWKGLANLVTNQVAIAWQNPPTRELDRTSSKKINKKQAKSHGDRHGF